MQEAFLLSLLARQLMFLGNRFDTRYPHAWLVWEASQHVRPSTAQEADAGSTRMATSIIHAPPQGSDAVCYPLRGDELVTVGRATTNKVIIDDMSMSRDHFLLFVDRGAWHLALAEPVTHGTFVRRMWAEAGKPVALVCGCTIVAGDVKLTFYERTGLRPRLDQELQRVNA